MALQLPPENDYNSLIHTEQNKRKIISSRSIIALGLLICVASFHASAQVAQGTVRLGADVNFASSTIENQGSSNEIKSSQLDLGLSAGCFVANNFEIALGVGLSNTKTEI
mgnify:CR=1 FL=1